jgi:hypothetical protein
MQGNSIVQGAPALRFLLAFLLVTPLSVEAQSVYRGRLILGSGPTTKGVINVEITVDHISTADELYDLPPFSAGDALDAFFEKARALKGGDLRYLGANGLRIDFNLAFESPTKTGKRIVLIAKNQSVDPNGSMKRLSDAQIERGLLLVLVLDLDKSERGEGKIYEEAGGVFDSKNGFTLAGSRTTPFLISNLKRK